MTILDEKMRSQTSGAGANIVGGGVGYGLGPDVMAASTLDGTKVMSSEGEHIGKIVDIMLDVRRGRVPYAVLPEGGFLGMGSTPHAIPWSALTLETDEKCFFATYRPNKSRTSPVSKDHWPSMADAQWGAARSISTTTGPVLVCSPRCSRRRRD